MRVGHFRELMLLVAALGLTACTATAPPPEGPRDPDAEHASLKDAWLSAPANTLYEGAPLKDGKETRSRAFLRRQAQNLAFRFPNHVPTRTLAGIMAYEARDPVAATRHLDHVLSLRPGHPEAAMLRAQIALEGGNAPYAVRLLQDQVRMRPDHAGLRELLASSLFMGGDIAGAQRELSIAGELGARPERIAYNRGLMAEQDGDHAAAEGFYRQALEHAPEWNRPQERLAGLAHSPKAPAADVAVRSVSGFVPPPPPPLPAAYLRK